MKLAIAIAIAGTGYVGIFFRLINIKKPYSNCLDIDKDKVGLINQGLYS